MDSYSPCGSLSNVSFCWLFCIWSGRCVTTAFCVGSCNAESVLNAVLRMLNKGVPSHFYVEEERGTFLMYVK